MQWTIFVYVEIVQERLDELLAEAGIVRKPTDSVAQKDGEQGWCGWPMVYTEEAGKPCFLISSDTRCSWPGWMVDFVVKHFSGSFYEKLNKDGDHVITDIIGQEGTPTERFQKIALWTLKETMATAERKLAEVEALATTDQNILSEYHDARNWHARAEAMADLLTIHFDQAGGDAPQELKEICVRVATFYGDLDDVMDRHIEANSGEDDHD